MRAIKEALKFIGQNPLEPSAQTLSRLVQALELETDFPVTDLYTLDYDRFSLALEILDEWRLDRYYAGKPHQPAGTARSAAAAAAASQ